MNGAVLLTAVACFDALAGGLVGYQLRPLVARWRGEQEFAPFMERIVNQEGAEERRNAIRRQLHDSGRRTMRLDGGKPAKVHRMRRRRGYNAPR